MFTLRVPVLLRVSQLGGDGASPEDVHMDAERAAAEGYEQLPRTAAAWLGLRYEVRRAGVHVCVCVCVE